MSFKNKFTTDDVRRMDRRELEHQFAFLQSEYFRLLGERSSLMKDINDRMQLHLSEIRHLKEVFDKAQVENQELRDLCCFLDDDRLRGRKQAKEWQRFGRYTSEVMRSEVAGYQNKLDKLEKSQESLVKENVELKQLCIDLSEEYMGPLPGRDRGDGSGSSSPATEKFISDLPVLDARPYVEIQEGTRSPVNLTHYQHIKSPDIASTQMRFFPTPQLPDLPVKTADPAIKKQNFTSTITMQLHDSKIKESSEASSQGAASQHSAPVDQYMKVLDLYEQMDSGEDPRTEDSMDHAEKAIVKEMCNVVWRKLGDAVPGYKTPV